MLIALAVHIVVVSLPSARSAARARTMQQHLNTLTDMGKTIFPKFFRLRLAWDSQLAAHILVSRGTGIPADMARVALARSGGSVTVCHSSCLLDQHETSVVNSDC